MSKINDLSADILSFFSLQPTGTQPEFVTFVTGLGHATAGETDWFAGNLVNVLIDGLVLPAGSDFDAMMARAVTATPEQEAIVIRNAVTEMRRNPVVRSSEIDEEMVALNIWIAKLQRIHDNGQTGRDWFDANAPDVEPSKGDTLTVLDTGGQSYSASIASMTRRRDDLLNEQAALGV